MTKFKAPYSWPPRPTKCSSVSVHFKSAAEELGLIETTQLRSLSVQCSIHEPIMITEGVSEGMALLTLLGGGVVSAGVEGTSRSVIFSKTDIAKFVLCDIFCLKKRRSTPLDIKSIDAPGNAEPR